MKTEELNVEFVEAEDTRDICHVNGKHLKEWGEPSDEETNWVENMLHALDDPFKMGDAVNSIVNSHWGPIPKAKIAFSTGLAISDLDHDYTKAAIESIMQSPFGSKSAYFANYKIHMLKNHRKPLMFVNIKLLIIFGVLMGFMADQEKRFSQQTDRISALLALAKVLGADVEGEIAEHVASEKCEECSAKGHCPIYQRHKADKG